MDGAKSNGTCEAVIDFCPSREISIERFLISAKINYILSVARTTKKLYTKYS